MLSQIIKPGYVYIMSNPSLPGWNKVGHTYRPPFRRAAELSRTSVPTPFEVEFAKFFWDCPSAEKAVHALLSKSSQSAGQRKEFFHASVEHVRELLEQVQVYGSRLTLEESRNLVEEDVVWEETLEGREEIWDWAEQDIRSSDPATQRAGWKSMERLSSMGWAEGSWRLAEHLVRVDMTQKGGNRAAWVLDAAYAQGMNEAKIRAAWLRSFESPERHQEFIKTFLEYKAKYGDSPELWPLKASQTMFAEISLWSTLSHRKIPGDWVLPWLEEMSRD